MVNDRKLLENAYMVFKNEGLLNLLREGFYFSIESLHRFNEKFKNKTKKKATNFYDKNWDVLIILDACRYDLIKEVYEKEDYDFMMDLDYIYSVGSQSKEWMKNTFSEEYSKEMKNTAYITGNMFSDEVLNSEDFRLLDEVWEYSWSKDYKVTLPNPITKKGIKINRNNDFDRLILHYMQPHEPFIPDMMGGDIKSDSITNVDDKVNMLEVKTETKKVWHQYRDNEISKEKLWKAYKNNLKYVLDNIESLLNNLEAEEVYITADHGNALGEQFIYGHPDKVYIEPLRKVPWIKVKSKDNKTITNTSIKTKKENLTVNERLEKLGYK